MQGCFLWSSQKIQQQIPHECLIRDQVRLTLPPKHLMYYSRKLWETGVSHSSHLTLPQGEKNLKQPHYLCDDRSVSFGAAFHSDHQRSGGFTAALIKYYYCGASLWWEEEKKEAAALPRGDPVIRWSVAWRGHQSCESNSDRTLEQGLYSLRIRR